MNYNLNNYLKKISVSSVSHDPSEIILTLRFAAQDTFLIIIFSVEKLIHIFVKPVMQFFFSIFLLIFLLSLTECLKEPNLFEM